MDAKEIYEEIVSTLPKTNEISCNQHWQTGKLCLLVSSNIPLLLVPNRLLNQLDRQVLYKLDLMDSDPFNTPHFHLNILVPNLCYSLYIISSNQFVKIGQPTS